MKITIELTGEHVAKAWALLKTVISSPASKEALMNAMPMILGIVAKATGYPTPAGYPYGDDSNQEGT